MGRVTVVSGPSCVGKSTYLARLVGDDTDQVVIPSDLAGLDRWPARGRYFHYNLLRPRWLGASGFDADPRWLDFLRLTDGQDVAAVVLVTAKKDLLDRIARRRLIEPLRRPRSYPRAAWRDLVERTVLPTLHREWLAELARRGVPYTVLYSTAETFTPVGPATAATWPALR